jgi:hypothetical protein
MRVLAAWGVPALLPAVLPAFAAASDIIFDSAVAHTSSGGIIFTMTDTPQLETASLVENPAGFETQGRIGASVTFAGTSRYVTTVLLWASAFNNNIGLTADVTLSIHTDGGGVPGVLLWSGTRQVVLPPNQPGSATFDLNQTLPDTVFYTLSYENISAPSKPFGVYVNALGASVGSHGLQRVQSSITQQWTTAQFDPQRPFELRFTAIPAGPCYANCDASTLPPILNVNDFICFNNRFAAGDSYANCDASTVAPVLNVNDFTCFLNKYAAGCP